MSTSTATQGRQGLSRLPDAESAPELPAPTTANVLTEAAADHAVTRGGTLQRAHKMVELRLSRKEIFTIDKAKTFTLQFEGYSTLVGVAGCQIFLPEYVTVGGREVRNPHSIKEGRRTVEVWVKAVLIGRSHNGNPIAVTQTITYSPEVYRDADLFNLIKRGERWNNDQKGYVTDKNWSDNGRLVNSRFDEADLEDHEEIYEVDEKVRMVVDLRSAAINKALNTYRENQKYAERKAITIAKRRCCQAFAGFPRQTIPGEFVRVSYEDDFKGRPKLVEAIAKVPVLGWIESDHSLASLLGAATALQNGERPPHIELRTLEDPGPDMSTPLIESVGGREEDRPSVEDSMDPVREIEGSPKPRQPEPKEGERPEADEQAPSQDSKAADKLEAPASAKPPAEEALRDAKQMSEPDEESDESDLVAEANDLLQKVRKMDGATANELIEFAEITTALEDCSDAQLGKVIGGARDALSRLEAAADKPAPKNAPRRKAAAKKGGAS